MLLSLNWLRDFADIPKSISPQELGRLLTLHTVEVDSIKNQAEKFDNFVIGKIITIKKHPNADKLALTKVDIGKKTLNIVCGAPNIEENQLVPVALVGAIMPNGMEIKETEIRGEKSQGMLCSVKELDLGSDTLGIMIINKKTAKPGISLAEYLKLDDMIYEIDNKSITNRPDLWGHYGIAREIAAFSSSKFKLTYKDSQSFPTKDFNLKVKIEEKKLCRRYMAISINNIKIEPSPRQMQKRLMAVGIRPINNIVDITNYVMLELGQPMHAFDARQITYDSKAKINITIRKAKDNEVIKTLNNENKKLDKEMLVIANKEPLAIAGIIGGANCEITEQTNSVLLECANFEPISIRKTAQILGLRTESSMRFEKDLDPSLCELAIKKAVELIQDICAQVHITSNLIDIKNYSLKQKTINLDLDWVEKKIGTPQDKGKIIAILEVLGFNTKKINSPKSSKIEVIIPTWRNKDVSIPEDLLEEIARIIGYDNIESSMPQVKMKAPFQNQKLNLIRKIKNILISAPALSEAQNYSFVGKAQLQKLGIDSENHLSLVNPIASHLTKLRKSLAPNLIENIKNNQYRYEEIGIFEIGNIYLPLEGDTTKDDKRKENLPYQETRLGIVLGSKDHNFSKLKGIIEFLLKNLGLSLEWLKADSAPAWSNPQTCAQINVSGQDIGIIAQIDNKIKNKVGVKKNVSIAEIRLSEVFSLIKQARPHKYKGQSKYPTLSRDLAFVVKKEILYNNIKKEIINFSQLIKTVELFDVYAGEPLKENERSLAFHIFYQADKTLTNEEVDQLQKKLIKHLEKKFEAKIRNF